MARGKLTIFRIATSLVAGLALVSADRALAEGPVRGEVLVVLAKEEQGPMEERLKAMPALQQPPFNAFHSMKLLSTSAIALDDGKPVISELPNGRRLQLSLIERLPDGRHKVQVSINRPNKKDYLPVLTVIASGEPFFVAGQKYQGGTLVIGVRIGEPKAAPPKATK
jgi:hypothetical protein